MSTNVEQYSFSKNPVVYIDNNTVTNLPNIDYPVSISDNTRLVPGMWDALAETVDRPTTYFVADRTFQTSLIDLTMIGIHPEGKVYMYGQEVESDRVKDYFGKASGKSYFTSKPHSLSALSIYNDEGVATINNGFSFVDNKKIKDYRSNPFTNWQIRTYEADGFRFDNVLSETYPGQLELITPLRHPTPKFVSSARNNIDLIDFGSISPVEFCHSISRKYRPVSINDTLLYGHDLTGGHRMADEFPSIGDFKSSICKVSKANLDNNDDCENVGGLVDILDFVFVYSLSKLFYKPANRKLFNRLLGKNSKETSLPQVIQSIVENASQSVKYNYPASTVDDEFNAVHTQTITREVSNFFARILG